MRRARCSECNAPFVVRQDGNVREHSNHLKFEHGLPWHPRCEGSGKPPRAESRDGADEGGQG